MATVNSTKGKRVGLYLRVSTDKQTTDNQRYEHEEVASRHGWAIVRVFDHVGIQVSKGRDERPYLNALVQGRCAAGG